LRADSPPHLFFHRRGDIAVGSWGARVLRTGCVCVGAQCNPTEDGRATAYDHLGHSKPRTAPSLATQGICPLHHLLTSKNLLSSFARRSLQRVKKEKSIYGTRGRWDKPLRIRNPLTVPTFEKVTSQVFNAETRETDSAYRALRRAQAAIDASQQAVKAGVGRRQVFKISPHEPTRDLKRCGPQHPLKADRARGSSQVDSSRR
jgi:hypothetical protein